MDQEPTVQENKEVTKINDAAVELCHKFEYEIMHCINCPIVLECKKARDQLEPLKEQAKQIHYWLCFQEAFKEGWHSGMFEKKWLK